MDYVGDLFVNITKITKVLLFNLRRRHHRQENLARFSPPVGWEPQITSLLLIASHFALCPSPDLKFCSRTAQPSLQLDSKQGIIFHEFVTQYLYSISVGYHHYYPLNTIPHASYSPAFRNFYSCIASRINCYVYHSPDNILFFSSTFPIYQEKRTWHLYRYLLSLPSSPVINGTSRSRTSSKVPSSHGRACLAPSMSTSLACGTSLLILYASRYGTILSAVPWEPYTERRVNKVHKLNE